jgi:hypothetical protein
MLELGYDYSEHYRTMFPHFGMVLTHKDSDYAYIPVPRCGSTLFLKYFTDHYNWVPYNYNLLKGKKFFTIVRDPYERYLSGLWAIADPDPNSDIVERAIDLTNEKELEKLYDDPGLQNHHTMLQYLFYENLDLNNITFFNFDDDNFVKHFTHFIENHLHLGVHPLDEWHSSDPKVEIKNIIEKDQHNFSKIQKWLEADYKFLSNIKYYESN